MWLRDDRPGQAQYFTPALGSSRALFPFKSSRCRLAKARVGVLAGREVIKIYAGSNCIMRLAECCLLLSVGADVKARESRQR